MALPPVSPAVGCLLVLSVAILAAPAAADCGSYADACPIAPGHLAVVNNLVTIPLADNAHNYFTVHVDGAATDDVTIIIAALFGAPVVYVSKGDVEPGSGPAAHQWTTEGAAQPDRISIPGSELGGGSVKLNIMVEGRQGFIGNSLYTLMVTAAGVPSALTDGHAIRDSVEAGKYNYYAFNTTSATKPLTFVLTPLSGDPDLYVSATARHPNQADHDWAAQSPRGDVITIDASHHAVGTTYFLSVYGFQESVYTLLARMDESVTLADGTPQHDEVFQGESHFFELHVGEAAAGNPVNIDVVAQTGIVSVYVTSQTAGGANNPPVINPAHYDIHRSAAWFTAGVNIHIDQGTAGFLATPGQYNVLVYGIQNSNYTITGSSDEGVVTLQEGATVLSSCTPGEYQYFQFSVTNSSLDVDIALTPTSGDPDLFVSCTKNFTHNDRGTPSRALNHYTWSSTRSISSDSIHVSHTDTKRCNKDAATGGTFYIAVYGYLNTTFSLVAESDNGIPLLLLDGAPQHGVVLWRRYRQYEFYLGTGHQDLTISVTAITGDPDIFVNAMRQEAPTVMQHEFSSASTSGKDSITIPHGDMCTDCWIRIAVYGYRTSQFVISATTSLGYRQLQDGLPVRESVGMYEYEYFKYTLSNAGQTLKVMLTTLSGDADLFVSRLQKRPGISTMFNATWYSMHTGGLFDEVSIADAPVGTYYISVRGFRNSTFTITAHAVEANHAEMVQLVLGQPQVGSITEAGGWAYFEVTMADQNLDETPSPLTITATPYAGVIGVYVNLCDDEESDKCDGAHGGVDHRPKTVGGDPTGTWSSDASISRESVQIQRTACASCSFVIGVYGHTPANFSVTAVTNDDIQLLQEGVPHRDYVQVNEYRYFLFTLHEEHQDVIVSVTRFTGDPDIYVDVCGPRWPAAIVEPCNPRPTNTSWSFARRGFGSDTLVIPYGSDKSCIPSELSPCDYYIGVFGFRSSSFSVLATLHSDVPTVLLDGVPQHGHVNQSVSNQYVLDVPAGKEYISIAVTPDYGDPDVFVTLDASKPGPRHSDYHSIASFNQVDRIIIESSDQQYKDSPCHPQLGCRVYIAVTGFFPASYSIVAVTDGAATVLQEATSTQASVGANEYVYFQFSVDVPGTTLSFTVTPINGDPDMYVAVGDNRRPTSSSYLWRASRTGMDVVDVFADDHKRCLPPCNYYIGVRGYGSETTFSIVAKQLPSEPTALVDGVPASGYLNQSHTDEYIIRVPAHVSGIDVVLTPRFGDADLFASLDGLTPSIHHYQYLSMRSTGDDRLTIRAFDTNYRHFCGGGDQVCEVRIAVTAFYTTEYSLVASTANSSVLLLANQPMRDRVDAGGWKYYVFHNDQRDAAITVILTSISGDPDMYVSTTDPRPNGRSHQWASQRPGSDVLDVFPGEDGACVAPCDYFIGVRGFSNSSYTILAGNFSGDPTQLVVGQPQVGSATRGHTTRYTTAFDPQVGYMEVSITPTYGDPDLFVTLGDGPLPTSHHYHYRSLSAWGQDLIAINSTDEYYVANCDPAVPCPVNVAVVAFKDTQFSIVASVLTGLTRLQAGVPMRDNVGADEYEYYVFTNPDPHAAMAFILTSFGGDPDMYVSISNPRPNKHPGNWTWRSERISYDRIVIQTTDTHRCRTTYCHYYVGVTGFRRPASYQLLALVEDKSPPTILIRGQPQRGHVAYLALHYYTFTVGDDEFGDISMTLTALNNPVGIYVVPQKADGTWNKPHWACLQYRQGPTGRVCVRAGVVGATWASVSRTTGGTINIPASSRDACRGCSYLVAVASLSTVATGSDYIITSLMTGGVTMLQDGVPVQSVVEHGEYKYYQMVIDEPRADVMVSLTTLAGDGVLFLDTEIHKPNATNHRWRSFSFYHDIVVLQYHQLAECEAKVEVGGRCMLYISVLGTSNNCSYLLTGSLDQSFTTPTLLTEGVPQAGFVNMTNYMYYMAHVIAPPDTVITISLTPTFGDPDLYVTTDGRQPGPYDHDFSSTAASGSVVDSVVMQPGHPHYCNHCVLNIAVYGYRTSQYTIVFGTSQSVGTLVDGEATYGVVQSGEYKYYRFQVDNALADVTFTLTPRNGGNPKLYAAPADNDNPDIDLPTDDSYTWAGSTFGANVIVIPHTDPHACSDCSYVVGVHAQLNTSFTIVASMRIGTDERVSTLIDGQPTRGVVESLGFKYYTLSVQGNEYHSVTFTATPLTGNVQLYLTNLYMPGNSSDTKLPNKDHSVWNTVNPPAGSSRYSITVVPNTAGWNPDLNVYTLGVMGMSATQFIVTATTSDVSQSLSLGVSSASHKVVAGDTEYFNLLMSRGGGDVKIGVTPLEGDPQLLVSLTHPKPGCVFNQQHVRTCFNYSYISTNSGQDVITVPAENYQPGDWFYIGVFAETTTTFSISAWADSHIQLTDGAPLTAVTSAIEMCPQRSAGTGACMGDKEQWSLEQAAFFQFQTIAAQQGDAAAEPEDVAVTVSQPCVYDDSKRNECGPELEVLVIPCNTGTCSPEDPYPTRETARFPLVVSGGTGTVFIPRAHDDFCDPRLGLCNYYVGVYPLVCPGGNCAPAPFQISYSTAAPSLIAEKCMNNHECLQPAALLPEGGDKIYEMYLGSSSIDLTVRLEACSGTPKLYMCSSECKNPFHPSADDNQWSADTAAGKGVAVITIPSAAGTYSAEVAAGDNDGSDVLFQLSASMGDVPVLVADGNVASSGVSGSSVTLSWDAPQLRSATGSTDATNVRYTLYKATGSFPVGTVATTACGLQSYAPGGTANAPTSVEQGATTTTVGDLEPETTYVFALVATCGSGCVAEGETASSAVFAHVEVTTGKESISAGLVIGLILLGIIVPGVICLVVMYRRNKRLEKKLQYEMLDVSGMDAAVSKPVTSYRPLLDDEGADVAIDDGGRRGAAPRSLAARVSAGLGRS